MIIDVKDEARIKELEEKKISVLRALVMLIGQRVPFSKDTHNAKALMRLQAAIIKSRMDCLSGELKELSDDELELLINYCKGFINGVLDLAAEEIKNLADNARFKCESKGAAND